MTKINFNYDPLSGVYLCCEEARESPNEPGVFLTPAYSTPISAPVCGSGQRAVYRAPDGSVPAAYTGGEWIVEEIPIAPPEPEPTPEDLHAKAWSEYQARAQAALDKTSVTIERIVEGVAAGTCAFTNPDVVAFMDYRKALRAIISATTGDPDAEFPTHPGYPEGT